jgi:signal transduction histidine kinase
LAVQSLGKMHAEQRTITHVLAERSQMLTGLSISVQNYNDAVQQFLAAAQTQPSRQHADRLMVEIDSDLKRYPIERLDSAEAVLFDDLRAVYLQQRTVYISVLESKPDERRRQAQSMIAQQMVPLQKKMLDWSGRLRVWNAERLENVDRSLVAELSGAQQRLTRALELGLVSGLLLVLVGMAYIVRLERQTHFRYLQVIQNRRDLQALSSRLVDAQETERRSISRELHDEIGQSLGALMVNLGRLSTVLSSDERPEVKSQLDNMKSVAGRTIQSVRNIALLLRPSMLDDLGLVSALEWQGREISRNSEVEVEVHSENVSDSLPDEYRICVYRLVQEALNNAVRHSGAKNAKVIVRQSSTGITVRITDDGVGFDAHRTRGLGLLGMEERVKRLSGTLKVHSKPGEGVTVAAELPIAAS